MQRSCVGEEFHRRSCVKQISGQIVNKKSPVTDPAGAGLVDIYANMTEN